MQLADRALVLARLAAFDPQHRRELVGIGIEFARPVGNMKPGLDAIRPQILANRIPRETRAPGNLPDRKMIPPMPTADDTQ